MASSYTSRIRLTKQADGENPNTWGTVLNNQVISLVDDAIASYTTVSIGSAATVTLSAVQGGTDVPRSAFLELIGSVGGSNTTISLIIPANSKSYVINNKVSANTTASDIIKMKNKYDDIIIDAGGRDTVNQRAALSTADNLLVPFVPRSVDLWTLENVASIVSGIKQINQSLQYYTF